MSEPLDDLSGKDQRAKEASDLVRLTADMSIPVDPEIVHRLARLLQAEIAAHDMSDMFP